MKKITRYARCFLAASIFCAVTFTAAFILQPSNWKPYAVVALLAGLIVTFLFLTMNQRLTAARLIVENQILYIQPAILRERDSIIFCNACATLCQISNDVCFRCKCPLLK